MHDLDHPVLTSAGNIDSWCARTGDLQHAFPLNISIVPSSSLIIASDGERLMCGGFSLGEIICFGIFEFITDYFAGLSLSPKRGSSGATFMDSTCSGTPSLWQAIIEDSTKEFLMASRREGGSGLPSLRRHGTGDPPAPVTATPYIENALTTQAMKVVPLRMMTSRSDTCLPSEQQGAHQRGQRAQARARQPTTEQEASQ
jgi:hypothetical protein